MIADQDMRTLGPGLYLDAGNNLHVDTPELLEYFGYADTPENRDVCTREAMRALRRLYPSVPQHVVEKPDARH
jgi:hypothetical protein